MKLYKDGDAIEIHPSDADRLIKQGWGKKAPAKTKKTTTPK